MNVTSKVIITIILIVIWVLINTALAEGRNSGSGLIGFFLLAALIGIITAIWKVKKSSNVIIQHKKPVNIESVEHKNNNSSKIDNTYKNQLESLNLLKERGIISNEEYNLKITIISNKKKEETDKLNEIALKKTSDYASLETLFKDGILNESEFKEKEVILKSIYLERNKRSKSTNPKDLIIGKWKGADNIKNIEFRIGSECIIKNRNAVFKRKWEFSNNNDLFISDIDGSFFIKKLDYDNLILINYKVPSVEHIYYRVN